jgi:uncharacterized lipoprotein YbaY
MPVPDTDGPRNGKGDDVMKRPTNRRTVLVAAGAAAFAAATGAVGAQSTDIQGAVTFTAGAAIPKGRVKIYLEDLAVQDAAIRRVAETEVESDGKLATIGFSLPAPADPTASPTLQIVARLERADGWLLARGSAKLEPGAPVSVTLKEAVY